MRDQRSYAFKTPEIHSAIRKIRCPGYLNVWERGARRRSTFPDPAHPNLWGTETFLGDWDGKMLVVLKDFASTGWLEGRNDGRPYYSHSPTLSANLNLTALLRGGGVEVDPNGDGNISCGALYASASFLLADGTGMSNHISVGALEASWPVLEFTIENMPNLTDVVLAGVEASTTFCRHGGLQVRWEEALQREAPIKWNGYRVHVTTHPAQRGINSRRDRKGRAGWEAVSADWRRICRHAFGRTPKRAFA